MVPAAVALNLAESDSDTLVRRPVIEPFAEDSTILWPDTVAISDVCTMPAEEVIVVVPAGFRMGPDR